MEGAQEVAMATARVRATQDVNTPATARAKVDAKTAATVAAWAIATEAAAVHQAIKPHTISGKP